jgi:hypothetical protein
MPYKEIDQDMKTDGRESSHGIDQRILKFVARQVVHQLGKYGTTCVHREILSVMERMV